MGDGWAGGASERVTLRRPTLFGVAIGGTLTTPFLESSGIEIETHFGTP